eukprot:355561-Chlamydomonas_euryale.AAC.1
MLFTCCSVAPAGQQTNSLASGAPGCSSLGHFAMQPSLRTGGACACAATNTSAAAPQSWAPFAAPQHPQGCGTHADASDAESQHA